MANLEKLAQALEEKAAGYRIEAEATIKTGKLPQTFAVNVLFARDNAYRDAAAMVRAAAGEDAKE